MIRQEKINNYIINFLRIFLIYAYGLSVLLISRIVFILKYGNKAEIGTRIPDLMQAFIIGFRVDTMTLTYFLTIPLLLALIVFCIPASKLSVYQRFNSKFTLFYSLFAMIVVLFGIIADFYFYRFFNDHLNILVFEFFRDDTNAVLASMWKDYPVIYISLSILLFGVISFFVLRRIIRIKALSFKLFQKQEAAKTNGYAKELLLSVLIVLATLTIYFTGMRSSWGTFPLRFENTVVSDITFINKVGLNGIYCLQNAFVERSNQTVNTDVTETLKKYGFNQIDDALRAYLDKEPDNHKIPHYELLRERTPENSFLARNPPNVVFVLMESMGGYLMEFHSKELNLLGQLEFELPYCYQFANFVSASNTTINTLEALIIGSPENPVSQSSYREKSLSGSVALPFLNAGYQTSFFTGGHLTWRNLENYLSKQYFQIVEGNTALKKLYPDATESQWGTFDEFLFERIFDQLDRSNGKPQFICAMTTSNHTPYDLPAGYKPYAIKLNDNFKSKLKTSLETANLNLASFQYANDCLGKFIDKVRNSSLEENTIIAITGDHSITQFFNLPDNILFKRFTVPFIIFVPDKYKAQFEIDQTRFGSHKDIFPTLFNVALSNATYLKTGNNLLSSPSDSAYFFGVNCYNFGISCEGCVLVKDNLYFEWADSSNKTLVPATNISRQKHLNEKIRAYSASLSYFIKEELKH
jgi:phosphoglycerol transferase MdoB-like AlkP superfamily enzyme